jgi:hypothetical protein
VKERAHWQGVLDQWRQRVEQAAQKLREQPSAARERLLIQMQGSVDQIEATAQRLPTEVGSLYEEDHHRLEQAAAALERLFARWNAV